MPADIAPSPITAIALPGLPERRLAVAKPSAAEMEVELCAAPNGSKSLSARRVKPESPPPPSPPPDAAPPPGPTLRRKGPMAAAPAQLVVPRGKTQKGRTRPSPHPNQHN